MKISKNITIGILLLLLSGLIITGFNDSENNNDKETKSFNNYSIFPVSIPENITFSGEIVPIHNFDVYESLDREILINTYWQSQTMIFLKRANRYFSIIEPILKENGIPEDFKYLAVAESGLSNITSPAGAKGFWQFLKGTATDYKLEVNEYVDERYHLEKSTEAACKYFKSSYEKYGSWAMAAASYNMGRRNLSNHIKRQKSSNYYDLVLGEETGRYVYRLIALKLILENPANYGFYIKNSEKYKPIPYNTVTVDSSVHHLADFAHYMGTNYKVLKAFNPWLRDNRLPNTKKLKYEIKIPKKGQRMILPNPEFFPEDTLLLD